MRVIFVCSRHTKMITCNNFLFTNFSFVSSEEISGAYRGGFTGVPKTPLDFTHQLKYTEIEIKGLQNLEPVMEQEMF